MANDKGRFVPLSLPRRMVCDFLKYSQSIPLAHGEWRLKIGALHEAVAAGWPKPNWQPIFLKAYAMVAAARPALRRSYVRYPWPRLYEHPENIASVAVSRRIDGEHGLLYYQIVSPEKVPLAEIDTRLKQARRLPLDQVPAFRRQLRLARLPWPVRSLACRLGMGWMGRQRVRLLGTFGMSVMASMGGATLATLVPWTTMMHYTPFLDDGSLMVRVLADHRVLDGLEASLVCRDMERLLNTTIADEVREMGRPRAAAA
jgi:hypothetical protein